MRAFKRYMYNSVVALLAIAIGGFTGMIEFYIVCCFVILNGIYYEVIDHVE